MEKFREDIRAYRDSAFNISREYEKSFVKYLIVGNGAAIGFIINLYNGMALGEQAVIDLKIPLWIFTLSIVLSASQFYFATKLANKYFSSFSSLANFLVSYELKKANQDVVPIDYEQVMSEFKDLNETAQSEPKTLKKVCEVILFLSVVTFCCGLLLSIYLVSVL